MHLLLSGGGNPEQVIPLDKFFAEQIDRSRPVLYIPVAMEKHVYTYEQCVEWFSSTYKTFGIENVEMCTDLNKVKPLEKYTAVFIGGGNTFKLLREIKESGFDKKLTKYLNNGGFIYGGSAGAIIFGKTVKTASCFDENKVGLSDFSGLNMANGKDIFCHYAKESDDFINDYDGEMYILYEESGLFIENGEAKSIGEPYLQK